MQIRQLKNQPSLNGHIQKIIISQCLLFLSLFLFSFFSNAHAQDTKAIAENVQPEDSTEKMPVLVNRETQVRSGDTLSILLARLGIEDIRAMDFIRSNRKCDVFIDLKKGLVVQATSDENHQLYSLSINYTDASALESVITISRTPNGFIVTNDNSKLDRHIEKRSGIINSSIFTAADAAGLPDHITSRLINLFSTNIDFSTEIKKGDRFNVIYESFWDKDKFVKSGNILAAELINHGKHYQTIWFERSPNDGGYYDINGKLLRKAFLKSPVEYTRISSAFSMRKHPVTGIIRAHKGIDLAAPMGTPVRAAGDGTILFAGWRGGYGNFIHLGHWSNYSTAYGHMSRIASGIAPGRKVRQGDVIGYVGSTGLSTGPHLHYEFRIDNIQHNPMQVEPPNTHPLTERELRIFRKHLVQMQQKFSAQNSVAVNETPTRKIIKNQTIKKHKKH